MRTITGSAGVQARGKDKMCSTDGENHRSRKAE